MIGKHDMLVTEALPTLIELTRAGHAGHMNRFEVGYAEGFLKAIRVLQNLVDPCDEMCSDEQTQGSMFIETDMTRCSRHYRTIRDRVYL